jgi:putative ABC transport system permease protein
MSLDDLRVAARTLRKQPGFSLVVIASLALAISLNTTMYAVLDALIHPRVDIREPERLYQMRFFGDYKRHVAPAVRDSLIRLGAPSIEAIAWNDPIAEMRRSALSVGSTYVETPVGAVSLGYMPLMGPKLVAGRWFVASDVHTVPRPIILHEQAAQRLFGPGSQALGSLVAHGDTSFVVIGILSRYAAFPSSIARAWTLVDEAHRPLISGTSWIVRVRPGVTRPQLDKELLNVTARIAALSGDPLVDDAFRVAGPTKEELALKALHRALILAVVAVLLVACANVANMQLARGIARGRELALRTALGATRARIIRHLLAESVLLAGVGLVLGLVATLWSASLMHASVPPAVAEYIVEPQISWRVVAFALIATISCIVIVGVLPAIKVSRVDPNEMLKQGHGTGATRSNRRQYGYLVALEMALALALLSEAVVTVRGALAIDTNWWPGMDISRLATGSFAAKREEYAAKPMPEVLAGIQQRLSGLRGVEQVSVDVRGDFENAAVTLADLSGARELKVLGYGYRQVTPNYIRTRRLAIIDGRDFLDGERDVPAIIVDEVTARKLWPNTSPVGALVKLGDARSTRPFVRVVGVFSYVDQHGKPRPADAQILLSGTIGQLLYLPSMQDTVAVGTKGLVASVMVRALDDPLAVAVAMRNAGIPGAATVESYTGMTNVRLSRQFMAKLFTTFAALALGLAAFGVYGVVAHSVAERRRELGVRIALGATSRDILRAVLRESLVIALSGVALGLYFTKGGVMLVGQLSDGWDVYNAPLFAVVAMFLFAVALLAAFVPARRATLLDPTESLRSE